MSLALAQLSTVNDSQADGCLPPALRAAAITQLREQGFPNLKTEDWKYTSLRALESREPHSEAVDQADVERQLKAYFGDAPPAHYLVFAGGRLQQHCSRPGPVTLTGDDLPQQAATRLYNALSGVEDAFVRLCLAYTQQAWTLRVDGALHEPLHIVHLSPSSATEQGQDQLFLHLQLDSGQSLDCVEHFLLHEGQFYNHCLMLEAEAASQFNHARILRNHPTAVHFSRTQVYLNSRAAYRHADAVCDGRLVRHEARIHYTGAQASATLASAALLSARSRLDQDWLMVHGADHCRSEQCFRAAVNERAAATYTGRARIEQQVNGSVVHQSSRGLMLSPDAEVNARPVLEIYADQVEASHGATVGYLDDDALHYLRARGIAEPLARQMLIEAFVNSAYGGVDSEALRDWLLPVFGSPVSGNADQQFAGEQPDAPETGPESAGSV